MAVRSLGICLGASTIKIVELIKDSNGITIGKKLIKSHESNPRKVFTELMRKLDINSYDYMALTGRKFRNIINTKSITELEAVEHALNYINKGKKTFNAIASLGSENFIVYILDKEGNISTIETGNKCASGTGEFFLQQIRRMSISPDDAVRLAKNSDAYRVSGRCSVFCKSDCTHALNKGIPIGRATAGLCQMMAEKIFDLLEKVDKNNIVAIGGVTKNTIVMGLLKKKIENLFIPDEADLFEALGAAHFAMLNKTRCDLDIKNIFKKEKLSFGFLPPINKGKDLVKFKETKKENVNEEDECIIGLDVGSTTTKAVIMRTKDNAVLAAIYLRTNGNPVKASRECYKELDRQINNKINIIGLGVTGSGRQIAGLHASTDGIINEIIAHATGAAYFDKDVDTIFEIGGQDAKYTYLTNSVPSDYAMNEACSAGTGSFLEESAKESLGLDYKDIEKIAIKSKNPPNFNDQCAAFISSDIKTATHEGIDKDDITAGLVYSICMNYANRVKGQRPTGKKIFMQGGVCYNKAVPLAMANLIGKEIIVPPDPGLIGAFGVALELKNRINSSLLEKKEFNLKELAEREIGYGKSFVCSGANEKCDRGCEISIMEINGKKYPFGGACNKYYNLIHHINYDPTKFDFVKVRQELVFDKPKKHQENQNKKIGISKSFLTNTFYQLFYNFFTELGLEVILSDNVDPDGIKRKRTSLCFPGEISHGCFSNLLKKGLDYIFLPIITELYVENSVSYKPEHQSTCVLLQSEAYYLKSAFKDIKTKAKIISPLINFSKGFDTQEDVFIDIALNLGCGKKEAVNAYKSALEKQDEFSKKIKEMGRSLLNELEKTPEKSAIVLFGRPYNAFAKEANLGIPSKFASRGIPVIPWESLPFEYEPCDKEMCWAIGQNIMKASSFVKKHPQLFGAYITNFSCGPDSFLVGFFRDIMKTKPSLTLELDSHTADAGVNTRVEAFLDIITRYREISKKDAIEADFTPAKIVFEKNKPYFISSDNKRYSLYDKKVHLLLPSMGKLGSEIISAAFTGAGISSSALPVYDFEVLKLGRGNTSCKECLPLQLTTGGLLKYLKYKKNKDELLVYFMPTTTGNCRFPQYSVFLRKLIEKNRIKNVALLSLNTENSYAGLPMKDMLNLIKAFIISDVMEDIKNALTVLAVNKEEAMEIFEAEWEKIMDLFKNRRGKDIYSLLEEVSSNLGGIPLRYPLSKAKVVSLLGEIFVRRDYFACQDLLERMAKRDIIVKRAHIFEWIDYIDYIVKKRVIEPDFDLKGSIEFNMKIILQKSFEKKIKRILSKSGLYDYEIVDIGNILEYGKNFFDIRFTGESILVTGCFFKEILHAVHGVVSIGPFACMPTRVIEAVLSVESTMETKIKLEKDKEHYNKFKDIVNLPFISIESDGNPFPQILEARIEAFCLQVERLHKKLNLINNKKIS